MVWCEDGEKTREIRVPAEPFLFHRLQASGHLCAPFARYMRQVVCPFAGFQDVLFSSEVSSHTVLEVNAG